jgi:hypothetical protein
MIVDLGNSGNRVEGSLNALEHALHVLGNLLDGFELFVAGFLQDAHDERFYSERTRQSPSGSDA